MLLFVSNKLNLNFFLRKILISKPTTWLDFFGRWPGVQTPNLVYFMRCPTPTELSS